MSLSIQQKSVYLIIYNATMISRSVGTSLKSKKLKSKKRKLIIKRFKIKVFQEFYKLIELMDNGKLKETHVLESIKTLKKLFPILSFGQVQKPINVLLKYHFHLTRNKNDKVKKILHCPIDSIILKEGLNIKKTPLRKINKKKYIDLQHEIEKRSPVRIEFDNRWDEQNLQDAGIPLEI